MNTILTALAATMVSFSAVPALALEVGDDAPCVVLEQRLPDGMLQEGCIREANNGQKFTLIEFFQTTCGACQQNLPLVSSLNTDVGDKLQIRLVGIDRSRDAILNYATSRSEFMGFPVALDTERDAKRAYGVVATPTSFILNSDYKVVFKHEGVFSDNDLMTIKGLVNP